MTDFSFRRDFKSIQWKETLQLNLIRSAFAGPVWIIIGIALGAPISDVMVMLLFPIVYFTFMMPLGLLGSFLSNIGIPFAGLATAFAAIFVAVGDPLVFFLKQYKPEFIPVEEYQFFNFRMIMFVLEPFDKDINSLDTDVYYQDNESSTKVEFDKQPITASTTSPPPASDFISKADNDIEACKQAIRVNPDDAVAHVNLGCAYVNSGMNKEAIESCKQAIRIVPDYAEAHNFLGCAYDNSGMYKEAIESYKQAIRTDPGFTHAHYNLVTAYVSLNDRDSALEQYKVLKSLDTEMAKDLFDLLGPPDRIPQSLWP
ncbi:MAG: tetratricopeptide repeat protein [Candidatus Scalindua sp.]|nr:tetratricopeptide repeat protein [Candidatus Scalindua sp.]